MFYVEQRFYDSGKTSAKVVSEEYVQQNGYHDGYVESNRSCDIYVDGFPTIEEARECIEDTKNA